MTEGKDQEGARDAGSDLRFEPAKPGREPHPAACRFEIGPGKIVAKGVETELLDLGDVLGRHVSACAHRTAQPLMCADAEQEPGIERLRLLRAGSDRQKNGCDKAREAKAIANQGASKRRSHQKFLERSDCSAAFAATGVRSSCRSSA